MNLVHQNGSRKPRARSGVRRGAPTRGHGAPIRDPSVKVVPRAHRSPTSRPRDRRATVPATDRSTAKRELIDLLHLAHSGELAAAYAYRGHWKSLAEGEDRARIRQIEEEEWHHRRQLREMLR